jgi:hypothetical protein
MGVFEPDDMEGVADDDSVGSSTAAIDSEPASFRRRLGVPVGVLEQRLGEPQSTLPSRRGAGPAQQARSSPGHHSREDC